MPGRIKHWENPEENDEDMCYWTSGVSKGIDAEEANIISLLS